MMKWSESESGCKQHPNNKQVPGAVCSSCLRDKLAQLCVNVDSSNKPITQMDFDFDFGSSSLSPPQGSHPQSKPISGNSYRRRYRRNASDGMASFSRYSMLGFNQCHGLNKSRSVAFATRASQVRDRNLAGVGGRKKKGFWSKLLKFTGKETTNPTATTMEPRA